MSLWFGSRSTRPSRVAADLEPSSSLRELTARLRFERGLSLRIGMAAVAVLVLALVVEGWRAPFSYRRGQVWPHGVTARVDFERVDGFATEQRRSEREYQEPFVFRKDSGPVLNLPARLRQNLLEVADAKRLEDLPAATRASFGLTSATAGDRDVSDMGEGFSALKAAVTGTGNQPALRIEEILAEFEEFLEPLRENGSLDPEIVNEIGIKSDQTLAIVGKGDTQDIVSPADVIVAELLKETGRLGRLWSTSTRLETVRPQLEHWLLAETPFTLDFDREATERARQQARAGVPSVTETYSRGTMLVPPGTPIDQAALVVLEAESAALRAQTPMWVGSVRFVTVLVLFAVLAGLNGYYLARQEPRIIRDLGRLAGYLVTLVLAVGIGRWLSLDPWRADVIALLAAVMVLAIAFNQVLAAISSISLVLVVTLSTVPDLGHFVVSTAVCTTAVIGLRSVSSRSTVIKVGFVTAGVYVLVTTGTNLLAWGPEAALDSTRMLEAFRGAGCCLLAGYLVAGSLPFVETAFGVVTDISLLEMSDPSHPLLQELVRRAPGTYAHSVSVATIGEAAADRIGANGLLVRVGAYFHDIGKMLKPEYFIENVGEGQTSRHQRLVPAMSTLVIIGHVKDGVELARRHNLPQAIVDFVEQHHGTTLVEYFYREAAKLADAEPDRHGEAEEASFRYPGPKPQSRETAVLMLADTVESATRALSEPTPKRIETLVADLVHKRLMDGQFDESSLTLGEIGIVRDSLVKSLIAVYHGRVKYPEQRTA